ncbi:MAG: TIM barrel protein [Candidatus Omnitrophica bacterium]|nr:TIM barrel protein [Candidatus Omnitrophota bacterium]
MSLGLSTSWNASRYEDAKKLVFEIKSSGFQDIELSFNLPLAMVEEIADLVSSGEIRVLSLHNFCPIPEGIERSLALPDCYSVASRNEEERQAAVKYTKRTIDTARRLGAGAVVLHTGRVEIADKTRQLIKLYENGLEGTEEFRRLQALILKERKDNAGPYFEQALRSLDELTSYAAKSDISLGMETRFYCREIPDFEEIGTILEKFRGSSLFYWHDTGHAQLMENLRFVRHKDFLEAYAKDMLGIHLHDITGCQDHKAPSKGELDFGFLKPYLHADTIKIIEAHAPATAQDLKESKVFLEDLLDGKA